MKNTEKIDKMCEDIIVTLNQINTLKQGITDPNAKLYAQSIDIMLKDVHLAIMRHYYREDVHQATQHVNYTHHDA